MFDIHFKVKKHIVSMTVTVELPTHAYLRAENCSGATMAFNLSITSQLEMLFPGSFSWGSATLT